RPEDAVGFVQLPQRWVVERTFAWLGRSRRLSKDCEQLTATSAAMLKVAMLHLMVRRLASDTPAQTFAYQEKRAAEGLLEQLLSGQMKRQDAFKMLPPRKATCGSLSDPSQLTCTRGYGDEGCRPRLLKVGRTEEKNPKKGSSSLNE